MVKRRHDSLAHVARKLALFPVVPSKHPTIDWKVRFEDTVASDGCAGGKGKTENVWADRRGKTDVLLCER